MVPPGPQPGFMCNTAVLRTLELVEVSVHDTAEIAKSFISRGSTVSYISCAKIKCFKFLLHLCGGASDA